MKKTTLLLALLASAAWAQDYSPPEGAHLVGAPARVMLRWPQRGQVLVTVYQGKTAVWCETRTTDHQEIELTQPGQYRWTVEAEGRKLRLATAGEVHHFDLSNRLHYTFPPKGQEGAHVDLNLEEESDLLHVRLNAVSSVYDFLLLPSSQPVTVTARGGPGRPGASGAPGRDGTAEANQSSPSYPLIRDPEPGGDGSPGLSGGQGGVVTVHGHGLDVDRWFRFQVEGGPGGPGGPGGAGGQPVGAVPGAQPHFPIQSQFPARAGQHGPDGEPGPPGQVIRL